MPYLNAMLLLGACTEGSRGDASTRSILPLGDSITEGVPFTYRYPLFNALSEDGYPFDLVGSHSEGAWEYPEDGWDTDHEGHSGWTTQRIQEALPSWLPLYSVDIALIHLGTNDAGEDNVSASYDAMSSIVSQLRAHNDAVAICIAQILPFGSQLKEDGESGVSELNRFVVDWNSSLETLASEMATAASPILLVDMYTSFGDADLDDGVHPNQSGAEKMAEQWLDCVSQF